jgi:hypothetical protein
MPGAVLGSRPHIEQHDTALSQPRGQLVHAHLLEVGAITEVSLGQHLNGCDVLGGNVTYRHPQIHDPIAGRPVEDPGAHATAAHETSLSQHLKMLRGIGDALPDLRSKLIDRPLALRQHVHDLCPPTVAERLCHGSERVEELVLGAAAFHFLKISSERLNVKGFADAGPRVCARSHRVSAERAG